MLNVFKPSISIFADLIVWAYYLRYPLLSGNRKIMKFIVDRMLGSLARWMRLYGIDAHYDRDIDRSEMIRIARDDDRTILTRASNFLELKHIPPYYLVQSEDLDGQLREVFTKFKGLDLKNRRFSRCIECNELLDEISKEDVKDRVPKKAYKWRDEYKICPKCERIYWEGTHIEKIKKRMDQISPL